MAAPNIFSLFEGYRAQADLERQDQQRAEQARAAQLNFDIQSRQEAEAQDGAQARSNQRQLDLNMTEFNLADQPAALEDRERSLVFARNVNAAKMETETPLLGKMASIVAETRLGQATKGLRDIEFSLDVQNQLHSIERGIMDENLSKLDRQRVASAALTELSKDEGYQAVLKEGSRINAVLPALNQAASMNNMPSMNVLGAQLGIKFKISTDGTGTILSSPAGEENYSPWLGQESVPGWAAMQNRKAVAEQRETNRAQAELERQERLALQLEKARIEQGQLELKRAELAAKAPAGSEAVPNLVAGAPSIAPVPGAAPATAAQAVSPVAAPAVGAAPAGNVSLAQRKAAQAAAPAAPAPVLGLQQRSEAYKAAIAKRDADAAAARAAQAQADAAAAAKRTAAAAAFEERRKNELAALRSPR